jgi:hypothetical protein
MPRLIALATALLAAAVILPASAQDTSTYRAGLKNFTIPAPTSELTEPGPDYRVLLEPLSPTQNRLIAAFLLPADLDTLRSGSTATLNRYALVEVLRQAEFADVTPEMFKQVSDAFGTQFGAAVDANLKDNQDEINRRLKALHSAASEVTLDKPVQLGALFTKPDACAFGMVMSMTSGGKARKEVVGVIAMRVRSRLVFLYTYTEFKDDSSVQWIRTTDEQWADAILQANK